MYRAAISSCSAGEVSRYTVVVSCRSAVRSSAPSRSTPVPRCRTGAAPVRLWWSMASWSSTPRMKPLSPIQGQAVSKLAIRCRVFPLQSWKRERERFPLTCIPEKPGFGGGWESSLANASSSVGPLFRLSNTALKKHCVAAVGRIRAGHGSPRPRKRRCRGGSSSPAIR